MKKALIVCGSGLTRMVNASYIGSSEFNIIFKDAIVIDGLYKAGKPTWAKAPIKGIFTTESGEKYVIYSDESANSMGAINERGYKL